MGLFGKPKPTVTPEDKEWIDNAFLWFEETYGRDFLKSLPIVQPTKQFFNRNLTGTEEDAEFFCERICEIIGIKDVNIQLYFFTEKPIEFNHEGVSIESGDKGKSNFALGYYSEAGVDNFNIGIESSQLNNPITLIAILVHELSHLVLLGQGRLEENDEVLTDLNCIVMGFGIFTANSIFTFEQWQGVSHQGWQMSRSGYIPEEVAAYALALFNNYQGCSSNWHRHLNKSVHKLYKKNLEYFNTTNDELIFS